MKRLWIGLILSLTFLFPLFNSGCASFYSATLDIDSAPPGVHVWDGSGYLGQAPLSAEVSWRSGMNFDGTGRAILEHEGNVKGKLEGYRTEHQSYRVKKDGAVDVFFYMQKLGSEEGFNTTVTFLSDPSGAVVTGDGTYFGTTPFEKRLFWSSRSSRIGIVIERPGYSSQNRIITHTDSEVNFVLQPSIPAPR